MDAAKFEKVVLMLSSDQPGEVFNAAQAIGRALPSAGLDWHKFAKLVAGRLGPKAKSEEPSPSSEFRRHDEARAELHIKKDELAMVEMLAGNLRRSLSPAEREFIESLSARIDRYGAKTILSVKQRKWLHDIFNRAEA